MGRPPSNGGQGGFAETDGEGRLVRRWAACNEELVPQRLNRFCSHSGTVMAKFWKCLKTCKVLRIFTVTGLPSAPEANSEVVTE